ncbi:MAG: tetratricopeptide repeat protein, partial [Bacteroidales bacterium]|nr:tetratricopeptide repeat protein [Bacteroidales bacterium]
TSRRVRRLVLDFERRPNIYRDVDDFLDIIDFYAEAEYSMTFAGGSRLSEALQIAEEIYPTNTDIKVQRARHYFLQGNYDSALNILSYLEKVEPDHIGVLLGLSDYYIFNNKFDKGMGYLKKALYLDPEDIEIYDLIIRQYLSQCKVEEALQYFKKRIALKSDDGDDFITHLYEELVPVPQVYESALKFFEAYIEQNPYSNLAWVYMAVAHYELHHDDEALEACEYALAISAESTGAYITKFEITEDRQILYDALKYVPEDQKYLINVQLAESYFRKHQYSSAAPYYREAIKYLDNSNCDDDLSNYISRNKLANCYMRLGDLNSAEKLLIESIALNPYSSISFDDLAILYKYEFHDAERFEDAFSFLSKKFKDCKFPWLHYIKFLIEQQRYEDVVEIVAEAEQSIPDDDDLYIPLAVAYYNTNRKNEAFMLLHNMDMDNTYLEDSLRKYYPDMLLDDEVMDILLQKRDESEKDGYYDGDSSSGDYHFPF